MTLNQHDLRRCEPHGLTYDANSHQGCTLCRKSAAANRRKSEPSRGSQGLAKTALMALFMAVWVGSIVWGGYAVYTRTRLLAKVHPYVGARDAGEPVPDEPTVDEELQAIERTATATPPLVARDGVDVFGYPRDYVDKVGLLALLEQKRFSELTAHIEQLQAAFEVDFRREGQMFDASKAFDTADPRLKAPLDEWTEANPGSFAPFLARARYRIAVAWYYRGGDYARETREERKAIMRDWLALADEDATKALALRPQLVAAMTALIVSATTRGDDKQLKRLIDQALAVCPACYFVRTTYLLALEPVWGGSLEEMHSFAAAAQVKVAENPRLKVLLRSTDAYRCEVLSRDKLELALDACNEATRETPSLAGYYWRAVVLEKLRRDEEALASIEQALELAPEDVAALTTRGVLRIKAKQMAEGMADLTRAVLLDPLDEQVVSSFKWALARERKAKEDNADPGAQRAAEQRGRAKQLLKQGIARAKKGDVDGAIVDIEEATRLDVSYLDAFLRLDYELARRREYSRVVSNWNRYVAANPSEPRGYLERGGAAVHAGNPAQALADLQQACDLGLKRGCDGVVFMQKRR